MAHTSTNTQTRDVKTPNVPAWHVIQKGDKTFWNKVGAAWVHKDGKGYSLQLEVVPINGRIVLRQPLEDTAEASDKEGHP